MVRTIPLHCHPRIFVAPMLVGLLTELLTRQKYLRIQVLKPCALPLKISDDNAWRSHPQV